jgi:hypothetical protein
MMRVSLLDSVKLTLDGMEYASELIDQISQQAIPFVEVPVHITYDEYTLAKGQKNLNALNIALRIIWVKFFR